MGQINRFLARLLGALPGTPTIQTTSGLVRGHEPLEGVHAYVGIPFALPPVGEMRFEPPEPFRSDTLIDKTRGFPSCYQATTMSLFMDKAKGFAESEDCLFVNIWKPATASPLAGLPVLLSFFGGAFTQGGTTNVDGLGFVAEQKDIIFVNFNYRLNIFGFPNTPALGTRNLGLLDQRLAVQWVRQNVAQFGGDPRRIVAIGDSAGAISIGFHAFAYANDSGFAGMIQRSGQPHSQGVDDGSNWRQVVANTNCTGLSPEISSRNLLEYGQASGGIPVVDNVTVFTKDEYNRRSEAGKFARVPLFTTTTLDEGDALVPFDPYQTPGQGINYTAAALAGAIVFTCPTAAAAAVRVRYDTPVWRAVYSGVFPELQPYPWARAYHGSDVWLFYESEMALAWQEVGKEIQEAGKVYRAAVAAFVRDPQEGLSKLGWPKYDANGPTVVNLFPRKTAQITFERPDRFDAICTELLVEISSTSMREAEGEDDDGIVASTGAQVRGLVQTANIDEVRFHLVRWIVKSTYLSKWSKNVTSV